MHHRFTIILVFFTLVILCVGTHGKINYDSLSDEEYDMLVYGDGALKIARDFHDGDLHEFDYDGTPTFVQTINNHGRVLSRFLNNLFAVDSIQSAAEELLRSKRANVFSYQKSREREEKDALIRTLEQKEFNAAIDRIQTARSKVQQQQHVDVSQEAVGQSLEDFDLSIGSTFSRSFTPPTSRLNCRTGVFIIGNSSQLHCTNETVRESAIVNNTITIDGTLYNVTQVNSTHFDVVTNSTITITEYYITQNGVSVLLNDSQLFVDRIIQHCNYVQFYQSGCLCPDDYLGTVCNIRRKFNCEVDLVHPARACQKDERKHGGLTLDGDFSCIRTTKRETQPSVFLFNMTCQFIEPSNAETAESIFFANATYTTWPIRPTSVYYSLSEVRETMLSYYYRTPSFALTQPITQEFYFKIFNFYKFSKHTGYRLQLEGPMFTGEKLIPISTIFNDVPSEYFAGNRLYVEAGFEYIGNGGFGVDGLQKMKFERFFIDFTDLVEPMDTFRTGRTALIVVGSVLGGLCLLGAILGVYIYRKKKEEREANEQEQFLFSNTQQHHFQREKQY